MKPLTPFMQKAFDYVAKSPATATAVGSLLTGRKSAYGWQTSAREGGRTLHALKRRGLVRSEWSEFHMITLWSLTPAGCKLVPENTNKRTVAPKFCSRCEGSGIDPEVNNCPCDCCGGSGFEE